MHGRVTLCLIAAALGIVLASPAVLAAASTGPAPSVVEAARPGSTRAPLATQCTVSAGSSGSPGGSGSGGGTTTVTCTWQGPLHRAALRSAETLLLVRTATGRRRHPQTPDYLHRHLHAGPGRRGRRMAGRGLASAPRCPHARPGRPDRGG